MEAVLACFKTISQELSEEMRKTRKKSFIVAGLGFETW
jgi:hypothetical protein